MRRIISFSTLILFVSLSFLFNACRKDDDRDTCKDPCKNAVSMQSTDASNTEAHFYRDIDGYPNYYYAVNYDEYASQIIRGESYMIAYKEVPCEDQFKNCLDIREGGCVIRNTCIRITCLKPVVSDCYPTVMNPDDFDDILFSGNRNARIEGNSLKVRVAYSGCSANDPLSYELAIREMLLRCPPVKGPYLHAKIRRIESGFTCQAVFERDMCFDLNPIKEYYDRNGSPLPAEITIRLENGTDQTVLTYKP